MHLSTRRKMHIAHILYRALRAVRVPRHQLRRINGITYDLDLAEGIDLSLFLFGAFQRHVIPTSVAVGTPVTIFDVGANAGVMSLQLAQAFPQATVHAFEPSDYANERFERNLLLNEALAKRIRRVQAFVSDTVEVTEPYVSYDSWRVDSLTGERHPVHLGSSHPTCDRYLTIDSYCSSEGIRGPQIIKIDTDGYEHEVLQGAADTIRAERPTVIFELATYAIEQRGLLWSDLVAPLSSHGYTFRDAASGRVIEERDLPALVPRHGSIDVLASP